MNGIKVNQANNRFPPKTTHVNTIRIFNLKCPKSKALNDFLQTNSHSRQWIVFAFLDGNFDLK